MSPQLILMRIIKEESRKIPYFVDTKNAEHRYAFSILSESIYDALTSCVTTKFHSSFNIESIATDIFIGLGEIKSYNDSNIYVLFYQHIVRRIRFYENEAVELELFEAAENFSKLRYEITQGYKNKKPNGKI